MLPLSQQQSKLVYFAVLATMYTVIAWVTYYIAGALFEDFTKTPTQQNLDSAEANSGHSFVAPRVDSPIQSIVDSNVFGRYDPNVQKNTEVELLPTTRLKLTLIGTFVESQPEYSSALISENGNASARYFIRDAIPGEGILKEVSNDYVLLERAGKTEALYFKHRNPQQPPYISKRRQDLAKERAGSTESFSQDVYIKDRLEALKQKRIPNVQQ